MGIIRVIHKTNKKSSTYFHTLSQNSDFLSQPIHHSPDFICSDTASFWTITDVSTGLVWALFSEQNQNGQPTSTVSDLFHLCRGFAPSHTHKRQSSLRGAMYSCSVHGTHTHTLFPCKYSIRRAIPLECLCTAVSLSLCVVGMW